MSYGPTDPNLVTLVVSGKAFDGWQTVSVTRGVEIMPGSFSIGLTERYPGNPGLSVVQEGQSCVLKFGDDVIITGYIDRYSSQLSPEGHQVTISGRGKCQDLVDCSAGILSDGTFAMSINASTLTQMAQQLAGPFGIIVTQQGLNNGAPIPRKVINFGETPFEIIETTARYCAMLAYEDTDGNLVLAQAGSKSAASGAAQGKNIEASSVDFSMDQRYSDYFVLVNSIDPTKQIPADVAVANGNLAGRAKDTTVPRFRPKAMVSEQAQLALNLSQQRADWEMNRRNGRSRATRVTIDSWRDSAGAIWDINELAPLDIPVSKIETVTWLIAEVTFRRDDSGTHADLLLMPPEAFLPEPTGLQGYDAQVARDLVNQSAAPSGPVQTVGEANEAVG